MHFEFQLTPLGSPRHFLRHFAGLRGTVLRRGEGNEREGGKRKEGMIKEGREGQGRGERMEERENDGWMEGKVVMGKMLL